MKNLGKFEHDDDVVSLNLLTQPSFMIPPSELQEGANEFLTLYWTNELKMTGDYVLNYLVDGQKYLLSYDCEVLGEYGDLSGLDLRFAFLNFFYTKEVWTMNSNGHIINYFNKKLPYKFNISRVMTVDHNSSIPHAYCYGVRNNKENRNINVKVTNIKLTPIGGIA
ncbi:hypothetical protein [Facklamia hominis]|uniref:Uncharacterized protein n=1 Tax=Facklamia hominis CCUG 36813 TaxID=883111 RepID=K1MEG7_9LACT|nr:hypothetical protein [Facklamia hominis]EKB54454.1 hypothetical protein HMPREF9706_00644 [Facklamia hominis CCUG 36813]